MPRGIGVGDQVALMMGNAPRMLAPWVGALRAGGIVVTLDTPRRAEGLAHLLKDSKPDLVVLDDEFTAQLEDMAATAWPRSVFRSAPRRSACAGMHHRFREDQSNSSRSGAGVTLAPGDESRSIR